MLRRRRELLGKRLALGVVIFFSVLVSGLASALAPSWLQNDVAAQTNSLAFTHETVIDATGQPAMLDRTVIVAGDRIQTIGKFEETKVPRGAKVIEARGKYMIPGLWDMHMHFRGGPDLTADNEAWLSIFLANGITGIREMGGDIAERCGRGLLGGVARFLDA